MHSLDGIHLDQSVECYTLDSKGIYLYILEQYIMSATPMVILFCLC